MPTTRLPDRYWTGLLVLVLAYSLIRLFVYEPFVPLAPWVKTYRQELRWVNITLVYLVGIVVIRRLQVGWMLFLWNLVHLALIGYLVGAALYERFVAPMPYGIRGSAAPLIEFLISPVYYMALGLLYAVVPRPAVNPASDQPDQQR
ncbi:MAG TPA: hypothetical protein PKE07_03570 [Lacibacter sp.]|nr:hypothetical protein [Lacibacter sp.]HMO89703.1 hypothetical protein [Lacibacter sp.]